MHRGTSLIRNTPPRLEALQPVAAAPRQHPGMHAQVSSLGSGFRVLGAWFMVQGSGCRVQGAGFTVQGSGCRVQICCSTSPTPGNAFSGLEPRRPRRTHKTVNARHKTVNARFWPWLEPFLRPKPWKTFKFRRGTDQPKRAHLNRSLRHLANIRECMLRLRASTPSTQEAFMRGCRIEYPILRLAGEVKVTYW